MLINSNRKQRDLSSLSSLPNVIFSLLPLDCPEFSTLAVNKHELVIFSSMFFHNKNAKFAFLAIASHEIIFKNSRSSFFPLNICKTYIMREHFLISIFTHKTLHVRHRAHRGQVDLKISF